ncbi:MAG: putative MAP kinase kinase family domain protein, partial [Streblomastix strix]
DIKALNIFIGTNQILKIGDLGVAKLLPTKHTLSTTLVGTPYYLSPEHCKGENYDSRADIWALGVVLHELLLLEKPFEAKNQAALALKIIHSEPRKIGDQYSSDLSKIHQLLLIKDANLRPSITNIMSNQIIKKQIQKYFVVDKTDKNGNMILNQNMGLSGNVNMNATTQSRQKKDKASVVNEFEKHNQTRIDKLKDRTKE